VHQSSTSSWKPGARHSLFKDFNLATVSEFTSREKPLYYRIQNKEGELCKLRKKCGQNLKFVSDVEGLMEDIFSVSECRGYQVIEGYF